MSFIFHSIKVHTQSSRYHLFPLTMINPVFHICQRQGVAVLWKGLGSTLVVRGMALAVEDVTSKVTPLPKYESFILPENVPMNLKAITSTYPMIFNFSEKYHATAQQKQLCSISC